MLAHPGRLRRALAFLRVRRHQGPELHEALITLPFVAYLVTEAVRWLAGRWRTVPSAWLALPALVLSALVVWNLAIWLTSSRLAGTPVT